MRHFVKTTFGQGMACYLIAVQAVIGWPLVMLVFLMTSPAQAQEADFSDEQRIGTIEYPAEVTPAKGQDEGLVQVRLQVPEAAKDIDLTSARIFSEPLVPIGDPVEGENAALASALNSYLARANKEDVSALDAFLTTYPTSRWKVALQTNLGMLQKKRGYFTDAMARFEEAWAAGKEAETYEGQTLANRALGELSDINARFGRFDRMKKLFEEAETRDIGGAAQTLIAEAKEGYWLMTQKPAVAFRCGPYAVNAVLKAGKNYVADEEVAKESSTQQGTNLKQLKKLSERVGMSYQAARKSESGAWVVPSVIQWKVGHFAALMRKEKGKYLVKDPTFGGEIWVTEKALSAEATGYGLVPTKNGKLPKGWVEASDEEAAGIWGKGGAGGKDDNECPKKKGSDCGGKSAMAAYGVLMMRGTLQLSDWPVGYQPPFGDRVETLVRYTHLTTGQPSNFTFANFGPFWSWNWGSYAEVDSGGTVIIRSGMGGSDTYSFSGFDSVRAQFQRSLYTGAILSKKGENRYEREFPNGSKEVYAQVDGTTGRIFLKERIDVHGNKTILNYDANLRLTSIVDGLSQATTITYKSNSVGQAGFYKVYRVTDPFARYAEFTYDANLTKLIKIRDVIGIESSFTYGDDGFITKLTTPYGDTQFVQYIPAEDGSGRGLQVTLPDGSKEVVESYIGHTKTTFYWDRKAMAMNPGDRNYAEQTNWLLSKEGQIMMDVPEWTKKALEAKVEYKYPDQGPPTESPDPEDETMHSHVGSLRLPSMIKRVLDDNSEQIYRFEYNALGRVTKQIDPVGRTFQYYYPVNNVDLYEIRQTKGGANDLLAKYTYNTKHQPLTYTDASGRKTTYTYNSRGQMLSVTNAKNETTAATYDANGYMTRIDGALSGTNDRADATYDSYGRVRTVTSNQGPTSADLYTLTYDYDALDRTTKVTFPDTTTDQTVYHRLDPLRSKDRLGRWTSYVYDSLRQLAEVRDPAGRITKYEWCRCGSLQGLTDPMGRVTKWAYDVGHRLIEKTYPDGSHEDYEYQDALPRMKRMTDTSGNVFDYIYNLDNTLTQRLTTPTSGFTDVPDVTLTWDGNYRRVSDVRDNNDVFEYAYNSYVSDFYGVAANGRGQLAGVTNKEPGSGNIKNEMSYQYDELGRLAQRQIDGVNNNATWTYDAAGRFTSWSNALGAFTPTYESSSYGVGRLASVAFPNGQTVNYDWENASGDFRIKQIQNLGNGSVALSQFDYVTDVADRILRWTQQRGAATPERYDFSYDAVDQLNGAVLKNTSSESAIKSYGFTYDAAGNRTSEQIDNAIMGATFNNLNQMTGGSAGGQTRFKGALNEPGSVTVGGQSAQMLNQTNFVASMNLTAGTNNIAVVAKDASNTTRTNNYQVVIPSGTSKTLMYDGNGNLLSDGTNTYNWDAKNRMVKITYIGGASSEFTYDLFDRRVKIVEKDASSVVTSTKQFVWDGLQVAEERDGANAVAKQYFDDGWRDVSSTTSYYYTKDHLGSIREVTDGSSAQVAQYSYDPYGRVTKASGSVDSDMLYTGHYYHAQSGLFLAPFRSYDPNLGRWISRDPIGEAGGINLYGYVSNNPVNLLDVLGLAEFDCNDISLEQKANDKAKEILERAMNTGFEKTYEELGLGPVANPGTKAYKDAPGTQGQKNIRTNFEKDFLSQRSGVSEGVKPFLWALQDMPDVYGPDSTAAQRLEQGQKNLERINEYGEYLEELKKGNGCN